MNNIAAWIMSVGIVLAFGFFLIAVFEEDPWEDHIYEEAPAISAGTPSPHHDDRSYMVCSSCHEIRFNQSPNQTAQVPPIVRGTAAPHRDGRERQVCTNCHRIMTQREANERIKGSSWKNVRFLQDFPGGAQIIPVNKETRNTPSGVGFAPPDVLRKINRNWHERFDLVRFQGKIIFIVNQRQLSGRKHVNILVSNKVGAPVWYNLAPRSYLADMKCNVGAGMYIKGTAYKERNAAVNSLQYGASISVNGGVCQLRDKKMIGGWEGGEMDLKK